MMHNAVHRMGGGGGGGWGGGLHWGRVPPLASLISLGCMHAIVFLGTARGTTGGWGAGGNADNTPIPGPIM